MIISSYRCHLVTRPASAVVHTSYGAAPRERPHVVVELFDAEGRRGLGESSPLPEFTGETARQVKLVLETEYLPRLLGLEVFNQRKVERMLDCLPGNRSARCAVDVALHDLRGHILGLPLYRLLGGAISDRVSITRPIGVVETSEAVRLACACVEEGFHTIKLKVGVDPAGDLERVRAVREAVGPRVRIRVDANQGYRPSEAVWLVRGLEELDIEYIEQPVPAWDVAGLRRVRSASTVPVAVDESVHTLRDLIRLGEAEAADVVILKLVKAGGITPALRLAHLAEGYGMRCTVVSTFDTQIGAAACLHLALAAGYSGHAHELTVFATQPHLADSAIRVEGGAVVVSEDPGLGVRSIAELRVQEGGGEEARRHIR